jgi:hypothetical protein
MWRTSYLEEAVWLGCNGVWPTHINKRPGDRHIDFYYQEYPEELMRAYNSRKTEERKVDIRVVFDVYGRTRRTMHAAKRDLIKIEEEQRVRGKPMNLPDQPFRISLI